MSSLHVYVIFLWGGGSVTRVGARDRNSVCEGRMKWHSSSALSVRRLNCTRIHVDLLLPLNRNCLEKFLTRPPLPHAAPSPQLCTLYWLFLLRRSRLTCGPTH